MIGRVINTEGEAWDDLGDIIPQGYYPALVDSSDKLKKLPVNKRLRSGIRVIDSMLPIGLGQSVVLLSGTGIGTSTLLSMIIHNNDADINVIGIIGDRERVVWDFLKRNLKKEDFSRSVVVVATSQEPAKNQLRAAYMCTAIAEYFRDQGKNVMLIIDSMTRVAYAQREIDMTNGKMPIERGYTSSVLEMLPKLMARSGNTKDGSITAIYTSLYGIDDLDNPIVDKFYSMLDSRIVLSRRLANKNHYPAIDLFKSFSKNSKQLNGEQIQKAGERIKELITLYNNYEKTIDSGYYSAEQSDELKSAIKLHEKIEEFLTQEETEFSYFNETIEKLSEISGIEIPRKEYEE
ncbi:MAG: flagellum-specific ATP synthase FliI [Treponema sp.]|nr:flagellum-specific ATP synthase FliI [Treponema sp.]